MNRRQALARARDILAKNNIEDASLEGEILLRQVLGVDRSRLYAGLEFELEEEQETALYRLVERRCRGEPSAYITGHREFYGLDFIVGDDVLIPRPETELLVEKVLEIARTNQIKTIADIGTGCGAIAISLAANLPAIKIYAADLSPEALEVAKQNSRLHKVADRVTLLQGNLLEPIPEMVDIIVANLPYISEADLAAVYRVLQGEPILALNGGEDGLEVINTLVRQAGSKIRPGGWLVLEVGEGQAQTVASLARRTYLSVKIDIFKDLAGIERVVRLRLT
jgi:release factor glutamine methyltransferase